jgi:hypothetical protein
MTAKVQQKTCLATRRTMVFRFAILGIFITSLACCGCSSVGLSATEKETVVDFVQKQTGEPVIWLHRRANGDVDVETDATGQGFTRSRYWLLKRAPDGWKLTLSGAMVM